MFAVLVSVGHEGGGLSVCCEVRADFAFCLSGRRLLLVLEEEET